MRPAALASASVGSKIAVAVDVPIEPKVTFAQLMATVVAPELKAPWAAPPDWL